MNVIRKKEKIGEFVIAVHDNEQKMELFPFLRRIITILLAICCVHMKVAGPYFPDRSQGPDKNADW